MSKSRAEQTKCNLKLETPPPLSPQILSFSGGGVLGTAHIGALLAFQEMQMTDGVEIAAGTSIGAFIALVLALNYPAGQLANKVLNKEIDFQRLQDSVLPDLPTMTDSRHGAYFSSLKFLCQLPIGIIAGLLQKGVCKGEYIEKIVCDLIHDVFASCLQKNMIAKIDAAVKDESLRKPLLMDKKTYDQSADDKSIIMSLTALKMMVEEKTSLTLEGFHQLKLLCPEQKFKDLMVTATNMCAEPLELEIFSYKTMPYMPIEKALHCSMAATPIYAPVEYNGKLYTDGGYLCNMPQNVLRNDESVKEKPMLCVEFGKSSIKTFPAHLPMSLTTFVNRLSFFPLLNPVANRNQKENAEMIYLNDLNTCIFDFNISTEQKLELITKGYLQTCQSLIGRQFVPAIHQFKLDYHYLTSKVLASDKYKTKSFN